MKNLILLSLLLVVGCSRTDRMQNTIFYKQCMESFEESDCLKATKELYIEDLKTCDLFTGEGPLSKETCIRHMDESFYGR